MSAGLAALEKLIVDLGAEVIARSRHPRRTAEALTERVHAIMADLAQTTGETGALEAGEAALAVGSLLTEVLRAGVGRQAARGGRVAN